VLIAVLVTVHEFGHFLAAKALGVQVQVFSIGFGNRLLGFRWGDTDYRLSMLPFGGYVRMAGSDPYGDGGEDDEGPVAPGRGFMEKPPWARLLIVAAGPAMNLVLPVVVFAVLYVIGEPQPRADVGQVDRGSVAEAAGVRPSDRITSVNGEATSTWVDVLEAFDRAPQDPVVLRVARGDAPPFELTLDLPGVAELPLDPYTYGILNTAPDATIGVDDPGSPAGKAGLRTGDRLLTADGAELRTINDVRAALRAPGPIALTYARGAETGSARLTPEDGWVATPAAADDEVYQRTGVTTATLFIDRFGEDSAAQAAGLSEGDHLLRIDERTIANWADVVRAVSASAPQPEPGATARTLRVLIRRQGTVQEITVTPAVTRTTDELGRYEIRPLLGIAGGGAMLAAPEIPRPYPVPDSVRRASRATVGLAGLVVEQLGMLVTGEASAKDSLGGPIEIFRQANAAWLRGAFEWARHLGMFSISLGVINLVPVPVLDGGQLVVYGWEWIRGRPLPLRLRERAQQVGVIFLVLLMLLVLAFDVHRWATSA
jgi:regulator of sigma E protease